MATAVATPLAAPPASSSTGGITATIAATDNSSIDDTATGTDSTVTVTVTALMQSALDTLGNRSREVATSLRVQRDLIVDGWADRLADLTEQYMEDKRQVRAHARRARHSLADRLGRIHRKSDCDTFPQFARLPAEIRLQIWEEALPGARAVMLRAPSAASGALRDELKFLPRFLQTRTSRHAGGGATRSSTSAADAGNNQDSDRTTGWTCPTPPPAMLHRYSLVFATTDDNGGGGGRIYADLSRDVVCLSSAEVTGAACVALWRRTRDLGQVRHLAVAAPACWGSWSSHYGAGFAHRLPPADLMGAAGFAALEDVVMVRSVRWQYGRLPRGARLDFAAWAEREEADEGLSRYHTRWRDGVMAISHGRRKSSETSAEP
ncbi:hypothetical protein MAPG_04407 [Magnaporthiopsis poae ATCC 64411]|uniref:2EXR domain-containing protein n=1 Tax=Magnaporthiopsis poae (strain ATCC 64411 / 73-15) TaxID=644358 RepID=A0A0C4DWM8_MAGP6|nr:hypothetical protein MAPG_04407 [Magnaporthiopsis poae ATCC 64411]